MQTIDHLLQRQNACLAPSTGDKQLARQRETTTRLLASRYPAWDVLRKHLFEPHQCPRLPRNEGAMALAQQLEHAGWLERRGPDVWSTDLADTEQGVYLRGKWLEEYTWMAYEAAGCDEAYFSQVIHWKADGAEGVNEMDVIARRGAQLSFASCKSLKPIAASNAERLRVYSHELLSWDVHFSKSEAKTLLVTTADLVDESRSHMERFPTLRARAKIYDMDLVGIESLGWDRLVREIAQHWD